LIFSATRNFALRERGLTVAHLRSLHGFSVTASGCNRITLRGEPLRAVDPFPAMIAKEIFDDSIFRESNDSDARAGAESVGQMRKPSLSAPEFVTFIRSLENLRGRMTTPMRPTAFSIAYAKGVSRNGAVLRILTIKLAIRRAAVFLSEIAKRRQLFAAVLVNDCSGSHSVRGSMRISGDLCARC
jgi:hypothetical protein